MKSLLILSATLLLTSNIILADPASETRTSHYFESIKSSPTALQIFLKHMPKGGDLHHHRSGSTYAENIIKYALNDNYCIDPVSLTATEKTNCKHENKLSTINDDWIRRDELINAWSMRNYESYPQSGHQHFFDTFFKFGDITAKHRSETLTEVTNRAGEQNELYLETMITTDIPNSIKLGEHLNINDYEKTYQTLQNQGVQKIVDDINQQIASEQKTMHKALHCGTKDAKSGCRVTQRYQQIVLRTMPSNLVFPQIAIAFLAASQNPLIVGVNFVGAEDDKYTIEEYQNQMAMIAFFHKKFPEVKIALHAGELWSGLVPSDALKNHIKGAVNIAKANRIGHGVDIGFEDDALETVKTMADKHIAVEVNLTSNAKILGVTGKNHPFMFYLSHGVPVVLSTDDEGVLRTNLTNEYQRAVETYNLSYPTLKMLSRNSLTYNFMPGASLWQNPNKLTLVEACQSSDLGKKPSPTCQVFLDKSPKATLQWQLESAFNTFEEKY